ncbi:hypothetical protein N8I77_002483 [Diaporthe amygdali]|uniref:Uncharacterized protein n=1 Tax=Phomopsis amygdali TaxID=1214568 RepID=A0AAD9WBD3_PHOAM|nr:hypothetical protein N8I77_002483 [Diaporthe amygdali]
MTSQNRQRGTYVYGEDATEALSTDYEAAKQRHATLYDAVAGRVSLKFSKDDATGGSHKTASRQHHLGDPVLTPEEVLFSRKRAPQRYAEKDIYFANESLPDGGRNILPDSDMVKAVHGYASHFYEALGHRRAGEPRGYIGRVNERSMDETAILAFGILLEEAACESLGKEGDLVFTEGVEDGEDSRGKRKAAKPLASQTPVGFEGEEAFWRRPYSRSRKVKDERE